LLRFHPHPSHRRSIGQTIGLTAYEPFGREERLLEFSLLLRTGFLKMHQ